MINLDRAWRLIEFNPGGLVSDCFGALRSPFYAMIGHALSDVTSGPRRNVKSPEAVPTTVNELEISCPHGRLQLQHNTDIEKSITFQTIQNFT